MNNAYSRFSPCEKRGCRGDKSTVCADMSYARRVALHEQRRRPGAIPYRIGEGRKDDRGGHFRIVNAL